jgi:phage repressor protein C with HTH and peptisase S24 domain
MNTSGDRLRALLRECHLSATDFAANRKVTPQHVNNWFKRGIPLARLDEVAELLTVNARWLKTGEGPKHPSESANENHGGDSVHLHHQGRGLMRGDAEILLYKERDPNHQRQPDEEVIVPVPGKKIRLPQYILQAMNIDMVNTFCVPMTGRNMADKIQDGSLIGIDRSQTRLIDGEMYAVEHSGMLRIAYLYRRPAGGLRLRSHNHHEYPDEYLNAKQLEQQQLRIIGWVFWWSTFNRRQEAPFP